MKKILLILAVVCAALAGCEKKGPTGSGNNGGGDNTGGGNNDGGNTGGGNTPAELVVNLEVVNIDNNQATIRVSLVSGEAYGGKIAPMLIASATR